MDFPMAQTVRIPPAMQETQVQSLGQEDPLEKDMASHSSILAWDTPWQRSLEGYSPGWGSQRVRHIHKIQCSKNNNNEM